MLSTSVLERGPPRLYHIAKSVLNKGAESLQKTGAGKRRDTARRSSERSRCQCLDVKEKHLTSFSRVSPACRRASVLATTMKLETPALSNNPLPLKSPQKGASHVRTHRMEMVLFWSWDSASLDGVGDSAAGDLHAFFFSSTPFSASELEKRKRFTLDIQGGEDGKTMT